MAADTNLTIYLGADHRGFALKAQLTTWLQTQGYQVVDCGNDHLDPNDDFPDFSLAVAQKVAANPTNSRGIIMCGSGVGANVAANKVNGAMASLALNPEMASQGRHDDDFNILVIAADFQPLPELQPIIIAFLETAHDPDVRYNRRLTKITDYEHHPA